MRWLLASALLLALLPPAGAQATATVVEDDPYDAQPGRLCFPVACTEPADPRVDLVRLELWDDAERVHVRLTTRDGPDVSGSEQQKLRTVLMFAAGPQAWQLRADLEAGQTAFRLLAVDHYDGSPALGEAEGYTFDDYSSTLAVGGAALPWSYEASLAKAALARPDGDVTGLQDVRAVASAYAYVDGRTPAQGDAVDHLPDDGGATHRFTHGVVAAGEPLGGVPVDLAWSLLEGVDFAGGPSLAMDGGTPHLAYYVYDAARGIYHATVRDGHVRAERVADYSQQDREWRDHAMRTHIALHDGEPAILFPASPGSGAGVRVAVRGGDGWMVEDPLPGQAADHVGAGTDLASGGGRLVAAIPRADGVAVVERTGGAWTVLASFSDRASLPRVAVAPDGTVWAAVLRAGRVSLASSADWTETQVLDGIEDRTAQWATAETDGSYDLALDGAGRPCLAWDTSRGGPGATTPPQGFGCLQDGRVGREPAPLRPSHGNVQLTMRLAFDGAGRAAIMSGYGGSDLVAVRDPVGGWRQAAIDRRDVFDFAMSPDGTLWSVATQPHGGTTLAVASAGPSAVGAPMDIETGRVELGEPGPGDVATIPSPAAALAALAVAGAAWRRRG